MGNDAGFAGNADNAGNAGRKFSKTEVVIISSELQAPL